MLGAVKLTKSADFDKYKYSRYDIGFDAHGSFSLSNGSGFGKNVIMFTVDMASSVHVDNRKKHFYFLVKVQYKD